MSANCPGFQPHGVKPTRCRKCFKEYSEHVSKPDEPLVRQKSFSSADNGESKAHTSSASVLTEGKSDNGSKSRPNTNRLTVQTNQTANEAKDENVAKVRVRTRSKELPNIENSTTEETSSNRRTRVRPSPTEPTPSTSSSSSLPSVTSNDQNRTRTRQNSELRLEPDGAELNDNQNSKTTSPNSKASSPKRVKIIAAEEVGNSTRSLAVCNSNDKTSPDVEFILRVKTASQGKDFDEDSIAATDTTETTLVGYQDTIDEYQTKVIALNKQLEKSEENLKTLEKQNNDLEAKIKMFEKLQESRGKQVNESDKHALEKTASELVRLRGKCRELETINTELKDEKNVLKIEVKELDSELSALKKENPKELKETITNLRLKLQQTEHICEQLAEENDEIKKDVKALEIEFQELHDNFREDQSSEFRVLKRELETTSKNCRVLQFKLKKAERSADILENEKSELDKKVKDLLETSKLDVDKHKMKELETELSIAKEVSLKLHAEIEALKEERAQMDQQLAERNKFPISPKSINRLSAGNLSPSSSFENKDYEQVVRDLYDTMEREKDLQEQMKFAEEETRTMRKKLSTMEQENEILMMQIRKMANQKYKKGDIEDESEELNSEEMKLHLELYEQEMVVLRRKTDELEQENENFQQEIKYLQEKLISQPLSKVEMPEIPAGSPPNVIYEHKIKMLESEARELRKKMVDREKENESLRTEIDIHRRKASKVIIRSRSLDSDQQVDLKRQLQLVEQEASILRQKLISLEGENDKLMNENKRFQLRLSRKPPPGPADQLQIENIELKDKIQDLERKCENIKIELVTNKLQPKTNFLLSDTESDLINTLKKQLKTKESEVTALSSKTAQLDVEKNRINREYKKLKETINFKRKPTRVVRETATRLELKDIIKEMEGDISDLQNTLKGKDVIIENLNEELSESKRDLELIQADIKSKDTLINTKENEKLKKDLENEKKKLKSLQTKVDLITKEKGFDFNTLDTVEILQAEKKEMAIKLDDIQEELLKEKSKAQDLSEKLTAITKQKEELIHKDSLSRTQKEKFEDENEVIKEKLRKAEIKLKEFTNKFESASKELIETKKISLQLKTELEQEKSKLAAVDCRASGVSANSALLQKEIIDLKKQLKEMNVKAENLKLEKDKEFAEKETKLKEECAKKLDIAVKSVRKEVHIELQASRQESTNFKTKINELNEKLEKSDKELKEANEKLKQFNAQMRKERDDLQNKLTEFESQIRAEQRKREKLEKEHEMVVKTKEEDLFQSRERVVQLEREQRRTQTRLESVEYEFANKTSNLERDLTKERQEYDELTNKYELLEKDFVEMKSRLITEKDTLVEAISSIRKSYEEKLNEIKTLKEAFSTRQKDWFKEKLDYQERIATLEAKLSRASFAEEEKNRLKELLSEKENQLELHRKEEKTIKEERDKFRRRCEELIQKQTDLERIERATRTMSITGRTQSDKELQDYRIRLEHTETSHKGEVAALHAEYEGRMKMMIEEITELQRQIAMLVNERDRLRDQLERDPTLRKGMRYKDDVEDLTAQIHTLRANLESALLENRNMKIQYGTERSSWQIQTAELKTQINQLEERILLETRGSTRSYAKTKMELAWDKERQDNLRLLQETQKFIQEMRDKLLAMETMREKERAEARKQLQELKLIMDKEQEDTQKRIGELQLDLLDLRESHSKVRSQNERLRRERASYEKEREDWRVTIFAAIDVQNKANEIINQIEEMNKLVEPENENNSGIEAKDSTATDPKSSLRKRKPLVVNVEELKKLITTIKGKSDEIRNVCVPVRDEDRLRRAISFRNAVSVSDSGSTKGSAQSLARTPLPTPNMVIRAPPRPKALAKKSLSLDHTIGSSAHKGASQERIWDSGDSAATTPTSSVSNLRVGAPYRGFTSYSGYDSDASAGAYSSYTREGSLGNDSDGSLPAAPHSKRSLKDKFKFIRKTNSIEDSTTGGGIAKAGLTSLALHGLEASPIEIAKQRQKKEHSLKHKISKTLSRTFSRSAQALQTDPNAKSEKRPTSPTRPMSPTRGGRSSPHGKQSPVPSSPDGQTSSNREKSKKTVFGLIVRKTSDEEQTVPAVAQQLPSKLAIPPTSKTPTAIYRIRNETNV